MIYIFTCDCLPQGVCCYRWSIIAVGHAVCEMKADVAKAPEDSPPYSVIISVIIIGHPQHCFKLYLQAMEPYLPWTSFTKSLLLCPTPLTQALDSGPNSETVLDTSHCCKQMSKTLV